LQLLLLKYLMLLMVVVATVLAQQQQMRLQCRWSADAELVAAAAGPSETQLAPRSPALMVESDMQRAIQAAVAAAATTTTTTTAGTLGPRVSRDR
jgi:hypothetical protein